MRATCSPKKSNAPRQHRSLRRRTACKPGAYEIVRTDALTWLEQAKPRSIHAVVTDPPYGLVEYSPGSWKRCGTAEAVCGGCRRHSTAVAVGRSRDSPF